MYKIDGATFNFKNDPTGSGVRIRTANYATVNGMTKIYKEIPMNSLDTLETELSPYFTILSINTSISGTAT